MAKKNMDILLGNILGKAAIHPQDRFDKSPSKRLRVYTIVDFSFIRTFAPSF